MNFRKWFTLYILYIKRIPQYFEISFRRKFVQVSYNMSRKIQSCPSKNIHIVSSFEVEGENARTCSIQFLRGHISGIDISLNLCLRYPSEWHHNPKIE